jgi:hypothetical protein
MLFFNKNVSYKIKMKLNVVGELMQQSLLIHKYKQIQLNSININI